MTQHTPTIGAGQTGLDYRTQDNDGKKALLNHHKGSSAPAYAEAGILWLDDTATPWILKIYDGTDWIRLGDVNASTNAFFPYEGTAVPRLLNDASDTGSANAYAVAPTPAIAAYATGQIVLLRPAHANTAASTLAVSGLTAKSIKQMDGSSIAAGSIVTTGVYHLVYDGTNFVLLNPSLGSAAFLTAGTAANNAVQLDGSARLPAVDGSQLTNIQPILKAAALSYAVSSGTAGPDYASATWNTVPLNTEDFDPAGIVSISSNRFTLAAGTYALTAHAGANRAGANQRIRIYNITDAAQAVASTNIKSPNATTSPTLQVSLSGFVTIAGSKAFELQLYADLDPAADTAVATGESEVYAQVSILKIA
jgi:hypothetical protein